MFAGDTYRGERFALVGGHVPVTKLARQQSILIQVTTPSPGLFENAIGTGEMDVLQGSDEANILAGTDQADTLRGLTGDDWLIGGPASDLYVFDDDWGADEVWEFADGGDDDVLDFTAVTSPLTVTIGFDIDATDGVNMMQHPGLQSEHLLGGASVNDTIVSGDGDNLWLIDGVNSGSLNGVSFTGIENLVGGNGNDTFDLGSGSLAGDIIGGDGKDELIAADVPTLFMVTSADAGTASNLGGTFAGVESLTGAANDDTFSLAGGTLSGLVTGGDGQDTLIGDAVENTFAIMAVNAGTATGVTDGFVDIENLVGNTLSDAMRIEGGFLNGQFDGAGSDDQIVGELNQASIFVITAANAGATDRVAMFDNIESLTGGNQNDQFFIQDMPFAGTLDGTAGSNALRGFLSSLAFNVTQPDEGNIAGTTTFVNIGNLIGSVGDDTFTLVGTGTLSGAVDGSLGSDTLIAADVDTDFELTGPGSGLMTHIVGFQNIENLSGGTANDDFVLNGGTLDGVVDGGDGDDTLTADNTFNIFRIQQANGGMATGIGEFVNVESLIGNDQLDRFFIEGGTLGGSIDGDDGQDLISGDQVENTVVVDVANGRSFTGVGGGFSNVENLSGSDLSDQFTVTDTGSLDGFLYGVEGDDTF